MSISPDFVKSQNQNTKLTFETTYEFKPEEFGYAIWDGKTGVETRYYFYSQGLYDIIYIRYFGDGIRTKINYSVLRLII